MHIPFIRQRVYFYAVSAFLSVFSLIMIFAGDIRLGIDLTGGTQAEYAYEWDISTETITTLVKSEISQKPHLSDAISGVNAYKVAGENQFIVEVGYKKWIETKQADAIKDETKTLVTQILQKSFPQNSISDPTRYINIGEAFGAYIQKTGILTLIFVVIAISLYIAYAFRGTLAGISSFSFGLVTVLSLLHDVLITVGLYILTSQFFPEFTIDTFFITAILTVLGYSINDTIVVMDRLRSLIWERVLQKNGEDLATLMNRSVNETLTRSIYTSLTVVIVLLAMFFFGPESLRGFMLALIIGALVGTYSSISIAAPLLYDILRRDEDGVLAYRDPKKRK